MEDNEVEQKISLRNIINSLSSNTKAILAIATTGLAIYFLSLFNGFVWDDLDQIINNPGIHSLQNIPRFFSGLTYSDGSSATSNFVFPFYRPLFSSFITLLYFLFHKTAFFYHLIQLVLHIINANLLFILFKRFFNKNLSFFLALLFIVHPITVESVAYVSAISEPLFFLCGLLAFFVFDKTKITSSQLLKGGFLFLCSLFAKETGILFLPLILIYQLLFKKQNLNKIFYTLFSVLVGYLFIRLVITKAVFGIPDNIPIAAASLQVRLYTMPAVFFYYIKTFLYPVNLAISQHWLVTTINFNSFYLPLISDIFFLLTIFSLGLYLRKNKSVEFFKQFLFFSTWFMSGMILHSQIIPLDMTVADRWFYFTLAGLIGILGVFFDSLIVKFKNKLNLLIIPVFVVLALFSLRTVIRNTDWKNQITLYSRDVRYTQSYSLETNLGKELYSIGKKQEALVHLQKSVELAPNYHVNWRNWAAYYYNIGDYKKAGEYYKNSIKNKTYYFPAYEDYGKLLLFHDESNGKKAKEFLEEGIKIFPQNSTLWLYLAIADYKQNLNSEALVAAKQAFELQPNQNTQSVYYNLKNNMPLKIE